MILKAIIVDDEQWGRENLANLISQYCPNILVVGKADSAQKAREFIQQLNPDLLFLDIQMPNETGFDLLDSLQEKNFAIIFVTAHNQFAIKAIKASAIDYLLKPISIRELKDATQKANVLLTERLQSQAILSNYKQSLKNLIRNIRNPEEEPQKISLQIGNDLKIIDVNDIMYLEADDNYTKLFIHQEIIIVSKTLKHFESLLDKVKFFRSHKSYLLNINYVDKIIKNENNHYAILKNDITLLIARRRLKDFKEVIKGLSNYQKK